ncbi:MAG: ROK family protein [Geobacter sp.]|nr:ROK family protein [Geobacter sp.]
MCFCTIGIDIGGTNLRLALITMAGDVLVRRKFSSLIAEGRDAFCERLLFGIEDLRQEAASRSFDVVGVGVGIPGLVDSDGFIRASVNMRPLDGFNLSSFLAEKTGLKVESANDANAIAVGEHLFGAGREFSSFMVITIGTGLGSGLILDGRLWKGSGGFASEFGHVTVNPDGHACPCGNHGCLERYVSADALQRSIDDSFPAEADRYRSLTAEELAVMAREGDHVSREAFRQMGRWLGIALASISNVLNLEAIIVGGGVGGSLDLIEPVLREELSKRCFSEIYQDLKIVKGDLGDDAGLFGAAALVSSTFRHTAKAR